jgi:hypothetical protein
VDIPQVSFAKGEVSPIAAARTDSQFYQSAVQQLVNFFVRVEGGISNRPGLQFIGNCLSDTPNGSYLLPFVFNNEQTYVTEFAAGGIQFYSKGAFVQNVGSVATITNVTTVTFGSTTIVTFAATNTFAPGNRVTVTDVLYSGTFDPNGIWTVASATGSAFTINVAKIASPFTYTSGGTASVPLSVANPYAFADLPNLRWAQSADVLNIVVGTQPLYELTRVTVNDFTFTAPTLLFGPFQDINTDGTTTVYATATQGTVTLTASAPIFQPAHVGALFSLQEQFFNSITPWEAQKILVYPNGSSPVGMYCRSDGKIYQCVAAPTSTDHTATGTFQPVHTSGTQQDGDGQPVPNFVNVCGVSWQFVSTDTGIAQITQYISPTQVKAVVQSYKGIYSNFPPTVVGGPQTVEGPFTFSGTGSSTTFSPLAAITTGDPNQFHVTVGGVFQDPSTYSISLAGTSITFNSPPAAGTNNIAVAQVTGTLDNIYSTASSAAPQPMTGLCLSTYWAFGSISQLQGYASDACYYNDRLVLSGTALQPQSFWTSQTGDYLNFGVSDPQVDSDAITVTINSRQQNPINNLLPMNNLLLGTASASWRATDSSGLGAITPSNIDLMPQEFYGMENVPAVQTGTTIIYVQWGGRKIRDILYQFYNDKFMGSELTVFARQMFPAGTTCTRMAFAPEPYGLIFCVRSDGVMCVCTYLPEQQLIAWSRYTTQGNFEDVCVVPEGGTFSVYVIVGRTIGGSYQRYIERFAPREYATLYDAFFVDSGLTYDGRNTSSATMIVTGGTTWLANDIGTLTASSSAGWAGFVTTDPGNNNAIWLNDSNGNRLCRLQITGYTSATVASVKFLDPVPASVQGIAVVNWTFARTTFAGLLNLVGETVSIFADGGTMSQQVVAADGTLALPSAGGVVHAGLPYAAQVQSLNLNMQGQPSIRNRTKSIDRLSVTIDESAPFMAGPDFDTLSPAEIREFENYGFPTQLHTGVVHVPILGEMLDDAYVCVEQSDPVPLTVLSWSAEVSVGEAG